MDELKNKFAKLIDLKSIITILMVTGLIAGWFMNKVTSEQFIPLVTTVLTFYFAKKNNTGGQE